CIYYQIHQCGAPCNFTQNEAEYREEVNRVNLFFKSKTDTGSLKILEDKMYGLSDEMKYEEAASLRDEIADLKKVILNMELTSSEVNLQNYIVKCKDSNKSNAFEVFLIANGRLLKSINMDVTDTHLYYEQEAIAEDINNIYFRGNLFNSLYYNNYGKLSKEELDKMKIISNWIYQNNSPSTLLKLKAETSVKDIMEFIF
ncbi:MAG: UvrB/UvrC motif-containing protein, partial [Ignavibacteria bacterium]